MKLFRMNVPKHFYLALFLCATVKGFPTDGNPTKNSSETRETISTESFNTRKSEPLNSSSVSTTSSLLFKDKKPILTYLLGQPKKQGSVSSPAHLLSPDRYEFFTFDDDGQIVKKLMSVKEIQKIIANNEKGSLGEHGSPIEYYQILTVTPDVESIPSVSRINPNEPLFSIHDVIASVQNVLKSEIQIKQSQSSSASSNNTNYVASASSDHFEILTEKPEESFKVEVQKVTSSVGQQNNGPSNTFTMKEEMGPELQKITTYRPPSLNDFIILQENAATSGSSGAKQPAATVTHIPVPLVSSSATPSPTPSSASPSSQETIALAASTYKVVNPPVPESPPLSLSDAHPGLFLNDTFLDMKPITVEQISRIAEPVIQDLKTMSPINSTGNFVKVETLERNRVPVQQQVKPVKNTQVETSTSNIQIPITPDLAESVSSVLWQIASENSMLDSSNKPTTPAPVSSAETKAPEFFHETETSSVRISSSAATTEVPAQSRSTVKVEKPSENPLVVLENILRPQNRPRPFQKIPLIEKGTPDVVESRVEEISSSTPSYELHPSPSSTVVILTESEPTSPNSKVEETTSAGISSGTNNEFISSTVAPQNIIVSVSPDAVVQSPEHVKPVTEKVITNLNSTNQQNQTQQTLEGVQVIQEASIGQIPRTTEFPGQVVKEIQRMEIPITGFTGTEESLSDSASNTFTTQLPYVSPEITTVVENIEERTEISVESETQNAEQNTATSVEPAETKTSDNEDQKEGSPSDRLDITFVPMVIKTPAVYKQEALLKAETETEIKEVVVTTEESETRTEVTETYVTDTLNPQDTFESKELPETLPEEKINVPKTTTELSLKEAPQSDEQISDTDFQMGTLKQNIQIKPHFGKPQKPVFIKPAKGKPQSEIKSPKPGSTTFSREPTKESDSKKPYENHLQSSPSVLELDAAPDENLGLEATIVNLDGDVKRFADLCNELAFSLWSSVTHNGLSFVRSLVISPFAVSSLLAMVFLGARGPTSGQMNDILKLDDMVTFNPHLVFRNVTESLVISRNPGVATAAFVRELYSDKSKGKLLDFYKERVQQFYDGHVEEVNFKTIGDTLRRQTNHLVKRQTWGKITDFLRGSNLMPRPPLAAFSANIFQTDCTRASTKDRDGEMYFVILPASRLRRLVPIPAVVWREGFLAGYEPNLDATAVSINPSDSAVSTIFVLPGQQGLIAPGDTLARLEHHLLGSSYKKGHWSRLMRSLLPRPGLELQIPRMSHKSVINVTSSLQRMGLKDLFSADKADLTGLNGLANDLHLSDMLQVNLFSTCGEEPIGTRHHSEVYPATPILRREKSADNIFSESVDKLFAVSDFEDPAISALPLELRPRQARVPLSAPGVRVPEPPRLRFDRPFLFFVRHNPTGLILHMGRFNPRLMP